MIKPIYCIMYMYYVFFALLLFFFKILDNRFIGCYEAPVYGGASNQALLISNVTREMCTQSCLQNGKTFSGVEVI